MNRSLPFLLCGAALAFQSAGALENTAWKYQQHVTVPAPGLVRVDLPVETLGASRSRLEDLRLLSPLGTETPFAIERATLVPPRVEPVKTFQLRLGDQSTVLELEMGTAHILTALLLESPAPSFVKAALVEGSDDGQNWTPLASSEMIFRQSNAAEKMRVPLAPGRWNRLRVTLGDQRSPPVPFTAARIELATEQPPAVTQKGVLFGTQALPRETQLNVGLGAGHLQVVRLKLDVADQVFSRRIRVSYFQTDIGINHEVTVASGVIYRVKAGDQSVSSLEIPIEAQVNSSQLVLTIENGDSPPLKVSGVEFTRLPVGLVFHALEAGAWTLLSGHRTVPPPAYDLQALQQQLGKITATALAPGPLAVTPGYKEPLALPGVIPVGATLDLGPWRYRKPLTGAGPGVLRTEPDAEMLAHAQSSLGDLRLVQDGKQIPFLTEASATGHTLQLSVVSDPDPKRPSVSRWRATLPLVGLPAQRLICTSPTPLFERTLEVWSTGTDGAGGEYRLQLGSGRWTRNAGEASSEFSLPLSSTRLRETFFIEAENGDNSPVALENVRVEYPGVSVVAKISRPGPLFLYYGNEDAVAPRYDLLLARQELLSAPMVNAPLGPEEKLRAEAPRPAALSAGSPWLWVALGLVLVVLLWVVAKMLPTPAAPKE